MLLLLLLLSTYLNGLPLVSLGEKRVESDTIKVSPNIISPFVAPRGIISAGFHLFPIFSIFLRQAAMSHYRKAGGFASIFINDDGLQVRHPWFRCTVKFVFPERIRLSARLRDTRTKTAWRQSSILCAKIVHGWGTRSSQVGARAHVITIPTRIIILGSEATIYMSFSIVVVSADCKAISIAEHRSFRD